MPQYIALKTMLGQYGAMHRGMTYTLPAGYARDLMRNGLVRPVIEREPPLNAALPEAPSVAGEGTGDRPAGGADALSSASLQVRPSRKRTAGTSNRGPK